MGGGHSIESYTESTINSVTTAVSLTLQQSQTTISQNQTINLICDPALLKNSFDQETKCRDQFLAKLGSNFTTADIQIIAENCKKNLCELSNVDMKQMLNANITDDQQTYFTSNIKNNVDMKIKENIQQEHGIFEFDDSLNSTTETTVNIITNFLQKDIQNIRDDAAQLQSIQLQGTNTSFVRMDQGLEMLESRLQNNKVTMSAINDLSLAISKTVSQRETKMTNIGVGIAVGLVALLVIIWLFSRRNRRRKGVTVISS